MRTVSLGHLVLEDGVIEKPEWQYAVNGQITELSDGALPDWNYFSDLVASCSVTVNLELVRDELKIPDDVVLGWVLVARSSASPIITTSPPQAVIDGIQEVSLLVPASAVGGTMTLELEMALLAPSAAQPAPFAPSKVGHTVYRHSSKLILEGDAGQLPILPVSFRDHGIKNPAASLWWLRLLSKDLHDTVGATLWMWLNTDNPQLRPLIDHTESDTGEVWMQVLKMDFIRQLLREALAHSDLDPEHDYPEGSLGALLLGVVRLIGNSVNEVRSKYADDPGRVEAELQGVVIGSVR